MPRYDYICRECGHKEIDVVKSFTDEWVPQHCGKDMSQFYDKPAPVHFKGGGFYSTGG